MTLYQFKSLSPPEQAEAVWKGSFLEVRAYGKYSMVLYDLGGFYVEVFYAVQENKIEKFRVFKSTTPLQPYLDEMKSDELNELL